MSLENKSVSFIGSGVMAEAMIKGLLSRQLLRADCIFASDPHMQRGAQLVERYGLTFTGDNREAAQAGDVIVLSVKPQVMDKALHDIRGHLRDGSLVLSIAAGVTIKTISQGSGNDCVVRSMPNTPGQIGQGITVWTATDKVSDEQRGLTGDILGALGETLYVQDEHFLDMATALNGTGPAYVFLVMEALIDAGVHLGFSRNDAERLVIQTMRGSVEYALASGLHPAQLRNQVTSPGGTSAAAIYQLEKGGLRTVISKAVWSAYQRSMELGKKDE
ncbi:MAG: pyrroline-5-carboxylate reductase [Chitinophagaceae bacterium]|nr:pyrroline-5-carboxylate reductase [Anaerolineae bacterium]